MNTGSSIYSTRGRFCWYYSNYWELHAPSISFLRSWLAIALHPWIRSSLSLRYMGASKRAHTHTCAMQWGSLRLAPIISWNLTIRLLPLHLFRFVLLPLHLLWFRLLPLHLFWFRLLPPFLLRCTDWLINQSAIFLLCKMDKCSSKPACYCRQLSIRTGNLLYKSWLTVWFELWLCTTKVIITEWLGPHSGCQLFWIKWRRWSRAYQRWYWLQILAWAQF